MDLGAVDAVVISQLHPDHVGGIGAARRRTFRFSSEPLEPRWVPAHAPAPMQTRVPTRSRPPPRP